MKTYLVTAKKDGKTLESCCHKKFKEALRAGVELAKLNFTEEGVKDVICTCMALEEEDSGDVNVSFEENGIVLEFTTKEA